MGIPTITQRSGLEGNFAFESVEGAAALPSTAHWRVTCAQSGRVLQDSTAATISTETTDGVVSRVSVTVEIPGSVNVLCDGSNQRETHVLTIIADADTDREYAEDFEFFVKRGGR
jgi:uncharacterized protein (DUF1684 family)